VAWGLCSGRSQRPQGRALDAADIRYANRDSARNYARLLRMDGLCKVRETSPGIVPFTLIWLSLSQRFPQQSAPLYSFVKSGYLRRPTMPLSALRYADGLFGEDHHPLKLFIPLEVLRQEVFPLAEEDVPLIEHQWGQFRFRRTSGAMGHRRSVEPYRSPLWYSREPSMRI
jgi:hypothetical protein